MIAALVRETDQKHWVGIYAAPTVERLREIVAETHHPSECEYACLPDFGLVVENMGAPPKLPLEEDDDEAADGDSFVPEDEDLYHFYDDLSFPMGPSRELTRFVMWPGLEWEPLDPNYLHYENQLREQLSTHKGRLKLLEYFQFMEAKDEDFPKRFEKFRVLAEAIKNEPRATEIAHEYFDL